MMESQVVSQRRNQVELGGDMIKSTRSRASITTQKHEGICIAGEAIAKERIELRELQSLRGAGEIRAARAVQEIPWKTNRRLAEKEAVRAD
jgi:hypothetical protein